uniref:Uncharacterized protein n=1 Tax=Anguilla anguilla TaxID=7936 RepID=A0A0E9TL27_ANGAN
MAFPWAQYIIQLALFKCRKCTFKWGLKTCFFMLLIVLC